MVSSAALVVDNNNFPFVTRYHSKNWCISINYFCCQSTVNAMVRCSNFTSNSMVIIQVIYSYTAMIFSMNIYEQLLHTWWRCCRRWLVARRRRRYRSRRRRLLRSWIVRWRNSSHHSISAEFDPSTGCNILLAISHGRSSCKWKLHRFLCLMEAMWYVVSGLWCDSHRIFIIVSLELVR